MITKTYYKKHTIRNIPGGMMNKNVLSISINWNNIDSINIAEKAKEYAENNGYTLINNFGGINKSVLIYLK